MCLAEEVLKTKIQKTAYNGQLVYRKTYFSLWDLDGALAICSC